MMFDTAQNAYLFAAAIGYLLGSIPFGLVFGKLFGVGDIRQIGSGNIGATNALRTGNKTYAFCVLLADALKGVLAVLLAKYFIMFPHAALIAGLAAVIGHVFPVWLKFKGGKGVATGLGVICALNWPTGICCLVMWLVTAKLSCISSLGALLAFLHAPIYAKAVDAPEFALPFAVIALLIFFTHRSNIKRLLNGEESSIKVKS